MDNFLARVAVEESPDFANVSDMVAGRLRERVYVGDHGHVCVKDTPFFSLNGCHLAFVVTSMRIPAVHLV